MSTSTVENARKRHRDDGYRTREGIQKHPEFLALTDKQKAFFLKFIDTGSREEAIKAAGYETDDPSTFAARELRKFRIRVLLAAYNGAPEPRGKVTKSELVELISERLRDGRRTTGAEFVKLVELLFNLQGRETPSKSDDEDEVPAADESKLIAEIEKKLKERNG